MLYFICLLFFVQYTQKADATEKQSATPTSCYDWLCFLRYFSGVIPYISLKELINWDVSL